MLGRKTSSVMLVPELTPSHGRSDEVATPPRFERAPGEARTLLKVGTIPASSTRREATMHRIREQNSRYSRVTAVFKDRALSFVLAKGATLEQLADRLANLGQRQNRRPVAITVKFGSILAQSGLSPSTSRPPATFTRVAPAHGR